MSALSSETYEFHKPVLFGLTAPNPRGTTNPSSPDAFNSGLASVDSGLQLNLEIALSRVSAKIQRPTAFSDRPKVR